MFLQQAQAPDMLAQRLGVTVLRIVKRMNGRRTVGQRNFLVFGDPKRRDVDLHRTASLSNGLFGLRPPHSGRWPSARLASLANFLTTRSRLSLEMWSMNKTPS